MGCGRAGQARPGFDLPPITFSTEQLEALAAGAAFVEAAGDADLSAAARDARAKIEQVLPEAARETWRSSPTAAARRAEARVMAAEPLGRLHGVPIGLKDLYLTKGVRTTGGSRLLADWVPDEDATVVTKLVEAGAIVLGKLNMHEFAFGPEGLNPHYGTAWNPWDAHTHRICGGSSSGSGAAVAAGLCPGALGSDTGGSIRIPAKLAALQNKLREAIEGEEYERAAKIRDQIKNLTSENKFF